VPSNCENSDLWIRAVVEKETRTTLFKYNYCWVALSYSLGKEVVFFRVPSVTAANITVHTENGIILFLPEVISGRKFKVIKNHLNRASLITFVGQMCTTINS
jgi:hypothetical protein